MVARFPDTEEVTGSNPVSPTRKTLFYLDLGGQCPQIVRLAWDCGCEPPDLEQPFTVRNAATLTRTELHHLRFPSSENWP